MKKSRLLALLPLVLFVSVTLAQSVNAKLEQIANEFQGKQDFRVELVLVPESHEAIIFAPQIHKFAFSVETEINRRVYEFQEKLYQDFIRSLVEGGVVQAIFTEGDIKGEWGVDRTKAYEAHRIWIEEFSILPNRFEEILQVIDSLKVFDEEKKHEVKDLLRSEVKKIVEYYDETDLGTADRRIFLFQKQARLFGVEDEELYEKSGELHFALYVFSELERTGGVPFLIPMPETRMLRLSFDLTDAFRASPDRAERDKIHQINQFIHDLDELGKEREEAWLARVKKITERLGDFAKKLESEREEYLKRVIAEHDEIVIKRRSQIAVQNTLELMREEKIDLAILIYGFGHTESVREELLKQGVSFLIVTSSSLAKHFDRK